jgi:hypothetical protein
MSILNETYLTEAFASQAEALGLGKGLPWLLSPYSKTTYIQHSLTLSGNCTLMQESNKNTDGTWSAPECVLLIDNGHDIEEYPAPSREVIMWRLREAEEYAYKMATMIKSARYLFDDK